jgi:hypothetical protein
MSNQELTNEIILNRTLFMSELEKDEEKDESTRMTAVPMPKINVPRIGMRLELENSRRIRNQSQINSAPHPYSSNPIGKKNCDPHNRTRRYCKSAVLTEDVLQVWPHRSASSMLWKFCHSSGIRYKGQAAIHSPDQGKQIQPVLRSIHTVSQTRMTIYILGGSICTRYVE